MISTHTVNQFRRYSTQLPSDPRYKLKAALMTTYLVSAFTLPFVPPLLETRRTRADGTCLTRENAYCSTHHACAR